MICENEQDVKEKRQRQSLPSLKGDSFTNVKGDSFEYVKNH